MIRKINLMSHTKKGNVHDVAFSVAYIIYQLQQVCIHSSGCFH